MSHNTVIGIHSEEDRLALARAKNCPECGVTLAHLDSPGDAAFAHHHHCSFHPQMRWERRKALFQAATHIYVHGRDDSWPKNNEAAMALAVQLAYELLGLIEVRNEACL